MREGNSPKTSILIVDDVPANLRLLAQVLAKHGYTVRAANSGALALSSAQVEPPDLVLLDLVMPEMDGYTVCERLKADGRTRDVPVIVVSALDEVVDKVRAFSLGAVDYITRPFQAEEIVARVETHLAVRDLQRQLQERNAQLEREIAERVQVEETMHRYVDEQAALYTIASVAASSLDPNELLSSLLDVVIVVAHASAGWVTLLDFAGDIGRDVGRDVSRGGARVVAWRGIPESFVEVEASAPLHTCLTCAPLLAGVGTSHDPVLMVECPRLPAELLADLNLHDHVAIPLSAYDHVLGILHIGWREPHAYSEADRALLAAIGQQVGLALRNAQLYQDARRVDRLETLNAVAAAAVSSLELDMVLYDILGMACVTLNATGGAILQRDSETGELVLALDWGDDADALRWLYPEPGQGIAGWVAEHGQSVLVDDARQDPRCTHTAGDAEGPARSVVCAPLRHREQIGGVIGVVGKRQGTFTQDDLSLLEAVAAIASSALENARLYAATRARAEEMAMLNELGLALTATLDPSAVAHVALSLAQRFFKADSAALLLVDPQADDLYVAQALVQGTPVAIPLRVPRDVGILGQVLERRQPDLIRDTRSDPRWLGLADRYAEQHLGRPVRSVMAAPLLARHDTIGILLIGGTEPDIYTHREVTTLLAIASTLAVALENARLYQAEYTARQQLRDLTAYLQTAREEERTRIAREIHDELGQALTALRFDLSWLTKRLPEDNPDLAEKAAGMSGLIDETIQTVRRVATELRPGLLDDLGLAAALEWQAQEFAGRTGIACELRLGDEDVALDRNLATAVFRIFQETLTNVARHAAATKVQVELERAAGELVLIVQDDGRGMAEEQAANPKSLGLMGMRERARALGGEVAFYGTPGEGTTVILRMPLARKEARR